MLAATRTLMLNPRHDSLTKVVVDRIMSGNLSNSKRRRRIIGAPSQSDLHRFHVYSVFKVRQNFGFEPTSGLRPPRRDRARNMHSHHRRKRRWLSSEPCHEARRGDNATTLRRAQLPNEPTSRRGDDAVAQYVLSNAVPSNAAPSIAASSNAAPSNVRITAPSS